MPNSKKTGRALKVVAIAQARMGSTRAPGKVMRDLGGVPVLQWTVSALRRAHNIDEVVLATSIIPSDDVIEYYCKLHNIQCFRGSEKDVLDRFYKCAKQYEADVVIRVTCDCPFLDPNVISEVIKLRELCNVDYASNTEPPTYPDGLDIECFTFSALEAAWNEANRPTDRDCVTQYIIRNRSRFPARNLTCPLPGLRNERWVLDTEDDYDFCTEIEKRIGTIISPSYMEILAILDEEPELREINNKSSTRNERFYQGLADEPVYQRSFKRSDEALQKALQRIPFGAQTFSKSHLQFPAGHSPLYVSHGDGARVFDVDGNDYVDLVSALLPVVLGYRDPDVDAAIRHQLDSGISFSLATELELNLADKLCQLIPCAEMVKFGKSGTDVTSAAIRLARAYTGRDHILLGGYHGWADFSMAATARNLGIPKDVINLSHTLHKEGDPPPVYPEHIAAIIIEPNSEIGLSHWRAWCDKHGIVLIFDEVITGFRYSLGGAQQLFGVTPDLACFGKSMANGMPISALVGKSHIMKMCQPGDNKGNIFYSGTFFGETLSIAAALATIDKMERHDVIKKLWDMGANLFGRVGESILLNGLSEVVKLSCKPPRIVIDIKDTKRIKAEHLKALFISEMAKNGVLIINANNMSYAHNWPELQIIQNAYKKTFEAMSRAISNGTVGNLAPVTAAPLRASA